MSLVKSSESDIKYEIWLLTDDGYRLIIVNTPEEGRMVMKQHRRIKDETFWCISE